MGIIVALTGSSGNMGRETLPALMSLPFIDRINLLYLDNRRERRFARKIKRRYGDRVFQIFGNIANEDDCEKLISDADYVINLAAVIPPASDSEPEKTRECNVTGVKNLVKAIERREKQPGFIHTSTVAVYGNRNYLHPWGRVGDPLLPSVYDVYAATKVKGERIILDSNIEKWSILRQTAILHNRMLTDNMKDGLMFHTCFNVPLEWVTSRDSGLLIKNIIKRDYEEGGVENYWNRVFNIGGGDKNRVTGYDTFEEGFGIIGGSAEKFMRPGWNSIRNFHGMWFSDSDELQDMFDFQRESVKDYWLDILKSHPYYKIAKILPPVIIRKLAIERLLPDPNSPSRWIKNGDEGKVKAYFGSKENLKCMPEDWKDFAVLAKGRLPDGDVNYRELKNIKNLKKYGFVLPHGYDETKADSELDLDDMRAAAEYRGGEVVSEKMNKGDLYTKLLWRCHDGHEFYASPYAVLKAGHWCPECTEPEPWDFDRLSKFMPYYANVWYDTHAKGENVVYFFDDEHHAKFTRF